MKTFRLSVFALLLLMLTASIESFAQPRGYRGRGYHYPPHRSFYPSRTFVSVQFGGIPYRYQQGMFYRPYGAQFRIVAPPIGIRVGMLPVGYRRVVVGPNPYYYYDGTYYRGAPDNQYEVTDAPLGASVDQLPPGSKAVVIDGLKYYEFNGTYYEEIVDSENGISYEVVGVNGVLNTDYVPDQGPQIGDRVDNLPEGAKEVTINGETLYSGLDGFYYKAVTAGDKTVYEIVGK